MAWSLRLKEQGLAACGAGLCGWVGGGIGWVVEHRWNWFLVSIFHVENWLVHPVVWSMGAVVLRKNLSKCVISPLMEHRRKPILLILQCLSLSFTLSLSVSFCPYEDSTGPTGLHLPLSISSFSPPPLLSSFSCFLMSPFHYGPSIYQLFSGTEWLSPMHVFFFFGEATVIVGLFTGGRRSYLWGWHRRHSLMELRNILYRIPVCLSAREVSASRWAAPCAHWMTGIKME